MVNARSALAVFHTAYAMALEGNPRVTATEISNREASDYGYSVTPSNIGQVFSAFGIKTATSHGKTRYVLDIKELERIREKLMTGCGELATKLEESLKSYKELDERVKALVARLQEVSQLRDQESDLMRQIGELE